LRRTHYQSKSKVDVSYFKKPQDEIHFCIKNEVDLYFTMNWNETTKYKKVFENSSHERLLQMNLARARPLHQQPYT
jgi:hypothetical protein